VKIVVNRCFGGFSLSQEAFEALGLIYDGYGYLNIDPGSHMERNDPRLVEVVERLGDRANGRHAELVVVEIPDDVNWEIHDYDGMETVREKHRSW
jgi:hypothetical protein